MARKTARRRMSPPGLPSIVDEATAIPRSFMFGLLVGLLVPVASIAGIVAGIYLFAKRVPFVAEIAEEDDERQLVVKLVEPEEARSLFQKGKEAVQAFGDDIRAELEAGK